VTKIVLVGAGSFVFARDTINDVLLFPELRDSTITLMDIDKERNDLMAAFAKRMVEQNGFKTKIKATTNLKESLDGADFVVVSIRAGGWANVMKDYDLTTKLGYESSPDALGPTGIFAGLRQIPAVLEICHVMEEVCPDALLLNFSNPMAMMCWAINDYSKIKSVGLCPNAYNGAMRYATYLGVPVEECTYWAAGLNHFTWYLEFKHNGVDAYPRFREIFTDPAVYTKPDYFGKGVKLDQVEVEMLKRFGYFTSGSEGHIPQYTSYFRKRPELVEKYKLGPLGISFRLAPKRTADENEDLKKKLASGFKFKLSKEYHWSINAAMIMHSIVSGIPSRIDGNVRNNGLITNLKDGCCVEVPCFVDKEGIHPSYIGDLPAQCAGLNQTSVTVQELTVRGVMEKDKTKLALAVTLDPLTAAMLDLEETDKLIEALFKIDKPFLKGFK
jgi:alpha-galactosidase